ncbi:putative F-box protein At1g19160 [Nicotiana tomentosiformis]|uniref:putative F-box protein At1g19160 n=1 Tax=Nicotiana tomentosiformis TaxID=4098 RepID=UPI00051ADC09|nr:F-box protein At1g47340-like [Nicotiana tomentosiformis]
MASFLPEEIIYHIFSWLPVESLMRFRCVFKFCNSLVFDPSFVDIHQRHSISRPHKTKFLTSSGYGKNLYTIDQASFLRIAEINETRYPRFGYVKGLFCLWGSWVQPPVIYNPITRKVISLPSQNFLEKRTVHYCSLGFEPEKKKYKILMITHVRSAPSRYWVFTLGSAESWREIKSAPASLSLIFINGGVCIDGISYFFGCYKGKACIAEYNVRTENFRIISLWKDEYYIPTLNYYNLIELEEKLTAIDHSRMEMGEMDFWILESSESSEEWVKNTIAFPQMYLEAEYVSCFCCSYTPNGEIVFIVNFGRGPKWILFYDWKKKSWRDIEIKEITGEIDIIGVYGNVDGLLPFMYC